MLYLETYAVTAGRLPDSNRLHTCAASRAVRRLCRSSSSTAAIQSVCIKTDSSTPFLGKPHAMQTVPTLATFKATRYLCPSFSSSAITQSVMQGLHSAYRQSIMPLTRSICMQPLIIQQGHITFHVCPDLSCIKLPGW